MRRRTLMAAVLLTAFSIAVSITPAYASGEPRHGIEATSNAVLINAVGSYHNWDGVSNVTQFGGAGGGLYYAIDSSDSVKVYKAESGMPVSGVITLEKKHPLYGTTICDSEGNFYLVTGEENTTDDTNVETVFISKYDSQGNFISTTGDNGSSSLAWYYDSSFYTKLPFSGGNCDAAVKGDVLTVNYARKMYSGHQSNSVFSVNVKDMSKVNPGSFYESHSFAQRVVPVDGGFVYASEGDCYSRSFTIYSASGLDNDFSGADYRIFDFWVKDGALEEYNMYVVNENFAHMGGLAALSDGKVAFAAQSARSLDSSAANENEDIFIQIFDPSKDLGTADAYVTEGVRSGLAGPNGREEVTNYGVKWLTSLSDKESVTNVQIASTDNDEIVIFYEYYQNNSFKGVYYIVLDKTGNIVIPAALFDANAMLNPYEMPVYTDGLICWAGNKNSDSSRKIYIYSLELSAVAKPEFTPAGGNYTTPQNVVISCEDMDAVIRYTLDGSTPVEESPVYSEPITVSENTVIKAIAQKGGKKSAVAEASYRIADKTEATVTFTEGTDISMTYGDADLIVHAEVSDSGEGTGTWTWTSSDASVATVSDAGIVTIVSGGTAEITAKYESDTTVGEGTVKLTIDKKTVTVTDVDVSDKVYDGGTSAVIADPGTLTGVVFDDDVTIIAGTAEFSDKNVGNKEVALSGFSLGGTKAGNYKLNERPLVTMANITPKELGINVTALDRKYEKGNTSVELTGGSISGVISGDDVTVDKTSMNGTMADADAGTAKPVTISGITLTGEDASNYTLAQPTDLTVNIGKAEWKQSAVVITRTYLYNEVFSDSIDLSGLLPKDSGTVDYGIPVVSGDLKYQSQPAVTGSVLAYTVDKTDKNTEGKIKVTAVMQNYEDIALTIDIRQDLLALYEKSGGTPILRSHREVQVNKNFTLIPMFADGRTIDQRVVWESSNPDVATVNQDGKVSGMSGGNTTITIRSEKDPDSMASCLVTVVEPVTEITFDKNGYTLGIGESVTVRASVLPYTAAQSLNWLQNNENVEIKVSKDKLSATVTGKKAGNTKITAAAEDGSGKKVSCTISVGNPVPDFTIAGKGNISEVKAGKTLAMTLSWNAGKPKNPEVLWSVTNIKGGDASYIATISDKGVLTGITSGKVIVKAVSRANPDKYAQASITVTAPDKSKEPAVTGIEFINREALEKGLQTGKSFTIKTKLLTDGTGKAAADVAWVTSDSSIATVSQKGAVKAEAPGQVMITAIPRDTEDVKSAPKATITFNVYSPVKSIKADKTKMTLGTQDGCQYGRLSIAKLLPENATNKSIEWTTNNNNLLLAAIPAGDAAAEAGFIGTTAVTYDGYVLALKAITPGVTKITGITTDGSKKKVTCTVTVRGQVTGLRLKTVEAKNGLNDVTQTGETSSGANGYSGTMKSGSSMTLKPIVDINGISGEPTEKAEKDKYNAYRKYTDTGVSYRSSDTSVLTVDKGGKISVKKEQSGKTAVVYAASADGKQRAEIIITVQ